jgi:hypothetical protein
MNVVVVAAAAALLLFLLFHLNSHCLKQMLWLSNNFINISGATKISAPMKWIDGVHGL